jgi:hypothetical protein
MLTPQTLIAHSADFPLVVTTSQAKTQSGSLVDEIIKTSVLCEPITVDVVVEHSLTGVPSCPIPEGVTVTLEAATLPDDVPCSTDTVPTGSSELSPPREASWTRDDAASCDEDPKGLVFAIDLAL